MDNRSSARRITRVTALDGHPFTGHPDGILGRPVQPRIKLTVPAGQRSLDDCSGKESVVLDQAKLVVFGIGHHDDHPFLVVVSLAREAAAQGGDDVDGLVDVIDGDV